MARCPAIGKPRARASPFGPSALGYAALAHNLPRVLVRDAGGRVAQDQGLGRGGRGLQAGAVGWFWGEGEEGLLTLRYRANQVRVVGGDEQTRGGS